MPRRVRTVATWVVGVLAVVSLTLNLLPLVGLGLGQLRALGSLTSASVVAGRHLTGRLVVSRARS